MLFIHVQLQLSGLRNTICKHIHFVAQTIYTRRLTSSEMEISELENVELEEIVTAEYRVASEDKEARNFITLSGIHSNDGETQERNARVS